MRKIPHITFFGSFGESPSPVSLPLFPFLFFPRPSRVGWLVGWFGPRPHFSRIRQRKKREKKKLLASASPQRTKLPSLPLPSSAVSTRPIPCGKGGGGGAEGWALTQFATSPSSPSPNRYKAAAEKIRPGKFGGKPCYGEGEGWGAQSIPRPIPKGESLLLNLWDWRERGTAQKRWRCFDRQRRGVCWGMGGKWWL